MEKIFLVGDNDYDQAREGLGRASRTSKYRERKAFPEHDMLVKKSQIEGIVPRAMILQRAPAITNSIYRVGPHQEHGREARETYCTQQSQYS